MPARRNGFRTGASMEPRLERAQQETLNIEMWFDGSDYLYLFLVGVLPFFFTLAHRALAAFRAIWLRRWGVRASARISAPFLPPSLPPLRPISRITFEIMSWSIE
jgi:hypothetical protein